jgi:DNA-binding winged helix-turn-helix (wHTH) protein/tetratricopeptide (TPR) repeat protein
VTGCPLPAPYEFEGFQLDVARYELRRNGRVLKLEKIPMELLILLISRQGELVSREEIIEKLWGQDVFIETEHGINTAVRKIRQTLGDDPERSRFVQTVVGKGYRFVGAVSSGVGATSPSNGVLSKSGHDNGAESADEAATKDDPPLEAIPHGITTVAPVSGNGHRAMLPGTTRSDSEDRRPKSAKPRGRRWYATGLLANVTGTELPVVSGHPVVPALTASDSKPPDGAVRFWRSAFLLAPVVLLGLGVCSWWFFFRRAPAAGEKNVLVLADFTNTTGDPVFDGTLRQGLSAQLEQSPFLSILPDDHIQETVQMMGEKWDTKLTPKIAREVCQRTASNAVLNGSIAQVGGEYLLSLQAANCSNGDSLAITEFRATDKNHVLDSLGKAASDIRRKLGESPSSIKTYDVPLERVTTSSLEALKLFSVYARGGGLISPVPVLQRVVELDPNFASAYVQLSDAFDEAGEAELASMYAQKAFDLCARVSERERLSISATYYSATLGDSESELRTLAVSQQLYPRDWGPWNNSSETHLSLGDYARGLKEAMEALRLAPNKMNPYLNVGRAFVALGRCDDAKRVAEQALTQGFDHREVHILMYRAAFLDRNSTRMERQMARLLEGDPAFGPLWERSTTEAYFGRLRKSRSFCGRALQAISGKNLNELSAMIRDAEALREIEFGNVSQANQGIAAAVALSSGRKAKILAALALARAGQPTRAQSIVEDLDRSFPSHTLIQHYWLPTIRASIELARKNPSRALDTLNGVSYELGDSGLLVGNLYPVYLRGQAYLSAHQAEEAATEFQRFLDQRSVALNSPLAALAQLGLARAYSLQGDMANARRAYRQFLTLWADADPDIPILKQAKAEYAKLQ